MTDEEIAKVEDLVNEDIKAGYVLDEQRGVPYDDAIKAGVIALFSEKYGDTVRTVRFGDSFELCGGTHTDNTLRIRLFKILSEGAIAQECLAYRGCDRRYGCKLLQEERG